MCPSMNSVHTVHSSAGYLSRVLILHVPQKGAQVTTEMYGQNIIKELNYTIKTIECNTSLGLLYPPLDTRSVHMRI